MRKNSNKKNKNMNILKKIEKGLVDIFNIRVRNLVLIVVNVGM